MMRKVAGGIVVILCVAVMAGCASSRAKGPVTPLDTKELSSIQVKLEERKMLSAGEREKMVNALKPEYQKWLKDTYAVIIIADEELFTLLGIQSEWDFEKFQRDFWERRSYDERGFRRPYKEMFEARVRIIKEVFPGVNDERAKVFLMVGPPADRMVPKCPGFYPMEAWYYPRIDTLRESDVWLLFYCPFGMCKSGWRLWLPQEGLLALANPVSTAEVHSADPFENLERCFDAQILRSIMGKTAGTLGTFGERAQLLFLRPPVNTEGVEKILEYRTDSTPGAEQLIPMYDPTVWFVPSGDHPLTQVVVNVAVSFDKTKFYVRELDGAKFYNADAIVKIIRQESEKEKKLIHHEGLQEFSFEEGSIGNELPCVVSAELRPGKYLFIVKFVDRNRIVAGGYLPDVKSDVPAELIWSKEIEVVSVEEVMKQSIASPPNEAAWRRPFRVKDLEPMPAPVDSAPVVEPPSLEAASSEPETVSEVAPIPVVELQSQEGLRQDEPALRQELRQGEPEEIPLAPPPVIILPVEKDFVMGLERFEAKTVSAVTRVEFYLDKDTASFTKTKPPYSFEFRFESEPVRHTVIAKAYNAKGEFLGEDRLVINGAYAPVTVRILTPVRGAMVSGPTAVQAIVESDDAPSVARVEFYVNDTLAATVTKAPYSASVNIPAGTIADIRVVATLRDGSSADASRIVNTQGFVEEIEVNLVELYATVTSHGKPNADLSQEQFAVLEDGRPQTITVFKKGEEVPLSIGVAVDTSSSMNPLVGEAVKSGVDFLAKVMRGTEQKGEDKAFTMGFGTTPYLLLRPTSNYSELRRSLAALRTRGGTALYDGIAAGVRKLGGMEGKKVLVVLSDGRDTTSDFKYETAMLYAKRSDVILYFIGFGVKKDDPLRDILSSFARATGGSSSFVDSSEELTKAYARINEELRSQYLLGYQSDAPQNSKKWRSVTVMVNVPYLKVRTRPGYYP